MKVPIVRAFASLSSKILPDETGGARPPEPDFIDLIEQARREWVAAKAYFENVSEPELVDHAIYLVEAAEKKYMYLLRKARDGHVTAQIPQIH
ncbi:MAG: YaaL family protein [Actinobacteria bacterium]|nr:YaaL family protein [Actinomycetota bacterium]